MVEIALFMDNKTENRVTKSQLIHVNTTHVPNWQCNQIMDMLITFMMRLNVDSSS